MNNLPEGRIEAIFLNSFDCYATHPDGRLGPPAITWEKLKVILPQIWALSHQAKQEPVGYLNKFTNGFIQVGTEYAQAIAKEMASGGYTEYMPVYSSKVQEWLDAAKFAEWCARYNWCFNYALKKWKQPMGRECDKTTEDLMKQFKSEQ